MGGRASLLLLNFLPDHNDEQFDYLICHAELACRSPGRRPSCLS